jgi:cell division septation protein DedD
MYIVVSDSPNAWREPPAKVTRESSPARTVTMVPGMPGPQDNSIYLVQVGAYKTLQYAREISDRLENAGFSPQFEQYEGLIRVLIPNVRGREIRQIGERLYGAGFREIWLREDI